MASTNISLTQSTDDKDVTVLAALCGNCCSLDFDDKGHGGFSTEFQNRCHVLEFEGDRQIFAVIYIEDILPRLPKLISSSQGGCTFCGFLKQAIINAIHTNQNQVQSQTEKAVFIGLSYQWNITRNSSLDTDLLDIQQDNSLRTFVAELEISNRYTETILLSVYSSNSLSQLYRFHRFWLLI
jgi:hypothetical protein